MIENKNFKMSFYTKNKNDFIETYCLVDLLDTDDNKYKNWYYVDSFYPKKLKKELMPLLEESLRYTFGITKFEYKDDDDEKDDDEIKKTPINIEFKKIGLLQ